MLSFRKQDRGQVADGRITVSFRLWQSPHVRAGQRYATGFGTVEIDDVRVIPAGMVAAEDVPRTGCGDIAAIWALAGEHTGTPVHADTPLHRVQFRFLGEAATSSAQNRAPELALEEVTARLRKLDERADDGPWTMATLELIEAAPNVPARVLAAQMGRDTLPFKSDVRKLKGLGLTVSHEVGYEISELGRRVLGRAAKTGLS